MISQSGPQRYISDEKAYDQLPNFISELGVTKVLFLHGTKSLAAAQPYLPDFGAEVAVEDVLFNGECSYEEIDRVEQIAKKQCTEMVIALGGGKVLDTAKSVTTGTHMYLVLIPTLASNCAPWSALSVHYKENGEHINHEIYKETANLMLLNPEVILNSPIDYFVAGIADTLAKFYESELIFEDLPEDEYTVALTISRQMANNCKDVLLNNAIQAVEDMKDGKVTHTWRTVAETVIVMAGTVGGWGDSYARSTGAHSVHDALTLFPQTGHLLHGAKVGYGILVQLVIEKHFDDINELLPFYRTLGVPTNFHELNLDDISEEDIEKIAYEATTEEKTMNLIPLPITADTVKDAMMQLEEITSRVRS
ncbi:iron-containing alcohol dehydrogenase family protein [Paucilactobacillus suebicus]|uniref:Glycerol dehydrogenase n=1 Tax=Paucilactobacillus suebicus DSM 5007 = KCTC 3549 TaxID=1423807 RepID=A0A0R1W408_9LACO|nr:iron-containing alcohol dehydrogenase family protein [Paucilactobacillus suebicus]KRM10313.1 glycerol dehydrogenase [Paucilactobacillus suebicus DSM 5007 = KCTC 3549]